MRLMDGPTAGQQGDPGLCRKLHLSHLLAAAGFFFFKNAKRKASRLSEKSSLLPVPGESSCHANATKPLPTLPVDFFIWSNRKDALSKALSTPSSTFLFFVAPERKLRDSNTCSHTPSSAKTKLHTTKLFVQSSSGVVDVFRLKVGARKKTQRLYSSVSSPIGASILFHPSIHFPSFCWKSSEAEREDVGCTTGEPRPGGFGGGQEGALTFFFFCCHLSAW